MVAIHLPQANPEQRKIFFNHLRDQAKEAGISYRDVDVQDRFPDFWGTVWLGESKVADFDMIRQLRDYTWNSYQRLIEQTKEKDSFDYKPTQEWLIFDQARIEHLGFKTRGFSVPVEAQAAFFSVMVSGV